MDLKKAFDTVSHDILFGKLESVGIMNSELDWFRCDLGDRTQVVKVNGLLSGEQGVWCGAPQGSTLGPLLFLIYINDVTSFVSCPLISFADDTVLFTSDSTLESTVSHLQEGLDKLMLWTRNSKLTINAMKSKLMIINPKKMKRADRACSEGELEVYMGPTKLEQVKTYKYLGVTIDKDLNFKQHLKQVIKNCAQKIYVLGKIRNKLTQRAVVDIYKTMIIPLLDYGDIFYDSGSKSLLNKLDSLERRAVRLILNLRKSYCVTLYEKIEIIAAKNS